MYSSGLFLEAFCFIEFNRFTQEHLLKWRDLDIICFQLFGISIFYFNLQCPVCLYLPLFLPTNLYNQTQIIFRRNTGQMNICQSATCLNIMRHIYWASIKAFTHQANSRQTHDGVIKWKYFPRYWPFVRGIHRSPVNSRHKGQWRGALMFSLIHACINGWVNNHEAGDLRRNCAHYDVIIMWCDHRHRHFHTRWYST